MMMSTSRVSRTWHDEEVTRRWVEMRKSDINVQREDPKRQSSLINTKMLKRLYKYCGDIIKFTSRKECHRKSAVNQFK